MVTENGKVKADVATNQPTDKKKWISFVLMICAAALIEMFIFNSRCYGSLFYRERSLEEFDYQIDNDSVEDISSLYINVSGEKIYNIYLDLMVTDENTGDEEGALVAIAVQDQLLYDGNALLRPISEHMVFHSIDASKYIFFPTYGCSEQIRINFPIKEGKAFQLLDIKLNSHRPLIFSWRRFLLMMLIMLVVWTFRRSSFLWNIKALDPGRIGSIVLFGVYLAVFLFTLYWVFQNPLNTMRDGFEPYGDLAQALGNGRVYVGIQDETYGISGGEMSIWHAGVDGAWFDHALYKGKYYVYYGILPCVLFYLPWYLITGNVLSDSLVQLVQLMILMPLLNMLLCELERRYFKNTSLAAHLLIILAMLTGSFLPCVVFGARGYCVSILCGVNSVILGVILWLKACTRVVHKDSLYLFLGSLCMASTSLSRPTMLLYSLIALPLFLKPEWFKLGKEVKMQYAGRILAFIVPYVIMAIIAMLYNYIRFDNPFEYGLRYNMTVSPPQQSAVYLPETILMCVYEFFLKIPKIEYTFPFLTSHYGTTEIMYSGGWYFFETVGYGLLIFNPVLWILFSGEVKLLLRSHRKMMIVVFGSIVISLFLLIFAVSQTQTVATRYLFEGVYVYFFGAGILWLRKMETCTDPIITGKIRSMLAVTVLIALVIQSLSLVSGTRFPLKEGNEHLFYEMFYDIHWY